MAIRKRTFCGATCLALFLALFLFAVIGMDSLINSVILDGVVLDPTTADTWGNNPGSTGTLTLRNFTFYNLTNPRGFLYRQEKPVFHEVSNFLLQERSNFTSIVYSPDRAYIDYNYWLHFTTLPDSRSLNHTLTVLNLAPLGFWSQLENIDLPALAIQGFGGLFAEMNATIKAQAIGQGVQGQFLANESSLLALCPSLRIPRELCLQLYHDPLYGLGDPNKYEVWVDFSYYNNSDSEFLLYEYFKLSRGQLQAFDRQFERWCFSVDSILDNWYCGGKCSNYQLTILQLSAAGVTANPPSGDAADSICLNPQAELRQNVTCQGYPELYSFHKYEFPKIDNSSRFKDLKFSVQTVGQLYKPHTGTLLNVGNLSRLFQVGTTYDSAKTPENLNKLKAETHGESDEHAIVIWQYVKYFSNEFVLQSKEGGTKKIAGLGGVFSQALYQSFSQFAEWVLDELLAIKVAELVPDCPAFLVRTIEGLTPQRADFLCNGSSPAEYRKYSRLIEPCDNEYFTDQFKKENGLLSYEIGELCNNNEDSILSAVQQAHAAISQKYHCRNTAFCTGYQLAAKQFINSAVTKEPLQSTVKQYPSTLSGHHWNPELQEWEYRHFLKETYGNEAVDPMQYEDYARLTNLLSFDKLFNGPMVQNLTLVQDQASFTSLYYFTNKTLLMNYIRFVTVEVGFGGFTQERTAYELLFGYEDPFLKNLKEMDPMLGGDPSIESMVALNQPNATLEQASAMPQSMYTGYSDPLITRIYRSYQQKDFITYNHTYYDGYKVRSEFISPYKQPALLAGTDAVQEKPMSTPDDNQYIFIDSLYRVGELTYNSTVKRFGFDALRYTISDRMLASSQEYPPNANFYQSIQGFMNLSFMGLPLFASKNHFLGAGPQWPQLVEFYDETGTHRQQASHYDDTEVIMEPKSGATFVATIYLQTNVYLQQDLLFTPDPRMMPVFTIYRSGNMTAQAADDLLGDLRVALVAPRKIALLSVFAIILTVFCTLACTMKQEKVDMSGSLLSSTHEDPENVDKSSDLAD